MANNILEMALEQLDFPPSTISAWFDDVTVVSFGDNRLVLHTPVPIKKEFNESKFIATLQLHLRFRSARRQRTTRFSSTATRVWVKRI